MTTPTALDRAAAALADRLPADRADALSFGLGFLEQSVKSFLNDTLSRDDLARNREIVELALDLHRDRRG